MFAQILLCAFYSVALIVKKGTYTPKQLNIPGAIQPTPAGPFDRFDLRKPTLPKPQYMRWKVKLFCRLADCAVSVWRFIRHWLSLSSDLRPLFPSKPVTA